MRTLLTPNTSTITELKKSPAKLLANANGKPVAILSHNEPVAYLVPAEALPEIVPITAEASRAAIERVLSENAPIIKALGDR